MNALAKDVPPPCSGKRSCYKCGRREPVSAMRKRRTPAGGAFYLCSSCDRKPAQAPRR
jgi:hypothetical protein